MANGEQGNLSLFGSSRTAGKSNCMILGEVEERGLLLTSKVERKKLLIILCSLCCGWEEVWWAGGALEPFPMTL